MGGEVLGAVRPAPGHGPPTAPRRPGPGRSRSGGRGTAPGRSAPQLAAVPALMRSRARSQPAVEPAWTPCSAPAAPRASTAGEFGQPVAFQAVGQPPQHQDPFGPGAVGQPVGSWSARPWSSATSAATPLGSRPAGWSNGCSSPWPATYQPRTRTQAPPPHLGTTSPTEPTRPNGALGVGLRAPAGDLRSQRGRQGGRSRQSRRTSSISLSVWRDLFAVRHWRCYPWRRTLRSTWNSPWAVPSQQPTVVSGRHGGDPSRLQLVQVPARATHLGAAQAEQPGVAGRPDRPAGRHREVAAIGLPAVFGPASQVDPPHHPRPRVGDPEHRTGHHQLPGQLGAARDVGSRMAPACRSPAGSTRHSQPSAPRTHTAPGPAPTARGRAGGRRWR